MEVRPVTSSSPASTFDGVVNAVNGVNIQIPDGAYCCLLGPSGCGKTTILRMIAGHEDPTGGEISVGSRPRIASMVTLLIMPMTLVNQAVVTFGLNAMRTTRSTGASGPPSARERKFAISVVMISSYSRIRARPAPWPWRRRPPARPGGVRPRHPAGNAAEYPPRTYTSRHSSAERYPARRSSGQA